mgnify:CR=1 FL=1
MWIDYTPKRNRRSENGGDDESVEATDHNGMSVQGFSVVNIIMLEWERIMFKS